MNRRHWGQDLENSAVENEYHWMAGSFFNWVGELVPGQYLPPFTVTSIFEPIFTALINCLSKL